MPEVFALSRRVEPHAGAELLLVCPHCHLGCVAVLDPAFSTLLRDLKERKLFDKTVVLCTGEFGRTPKINPAGGRDHWTNGFSLALAGGGIRGGQALGATDPEGRQDPPVDDSEELEVEPPEPDFVVRRGSRISVPTDEQPTEESVAVRGSTLRK